MPDPRASDLARLADRVQGPLHRPGDDDYDQAGAVWNARFVRRPALVVRCAGPEDVAEAVRFARREGLPLSVKGGGHDYAGNTVAEGSLLLDLGVMNSVEVDPRSRRAKVGGGARWADVDGVTTPHGLAPVGSTVSSVGVGGFTLGGGLGWLSRKHGLAVDNVEAVEVVTADGAVRRVDEDEHPDLFWALRGGGGNFGVATAFEVALHPVPEEILTGQIFYPAEDAAHLLRRFRDLFHEAPDPLVCFPFLLRIPPVDPFPPTTHGRLALDFVVAYLGPPDDAEAHLASFRGWGEPLVEFVGRQSYLELQRAFDEGMPPGNRWHSRSRHLDGLTDEAIDTLVEGLDPFPGSYTVVYLSPLGGAIGRAAGDATAYPHRSSRYELHILPGWTGPELDEAAIEWADGLHRAMLPHGNGGVYVNLLGDGEGDRIEEAYGTNLSRLRAVKGRWDPDNLFRQNHNIEPPE